LLELQELGLELLLLLQLPRLLLQWTRLLLLLELLLLLLHELHELLLLLLELLLLELLLLLLGKFLLFVLLLVPHFALPEFLDLVAQALEFQEFLLLHLHLQRIVQAALRFEAVARPICNGAALCAWLGVMGVESVEPRLHCLRRVCKMFCAMVLRGLCTRSLKGPARCP